MKIKYKLRVNFTRIYSKTILCLHLMTKLSATVKYIQLLYIRFSLFIETFFKHLDSTNRNDVYLLHKYVRALTDALLPSSFRNCIQMAPPVLQHYTTTITFFYYKLTTPLFRKAGKESKQGSSCFCCNCQP